jgi:Protein of unknown function DUF262
VRTPELANDLVLYDPSEETEEDLGQGLQESFASVSLAYTDWTTGSLLDQIRLGNVDLNPRFQRRDVWSVERKSRLIESLVLNLPIPQLVLAEQPAQRGRFIVLDGRQRLLAIRRFGATKGEAFEPLNLHGLTLLKRLNGTTLADLSKRVDLADDYAAFINASLRTVIVRRWPNEDYLRLIFYRLNTESTPLSPQELRQALFPGKFTDFVDDYSSNSAALRRALGIKGPDFRMRDSELLLRFLAFDYFLREYRGNLKDFLDRTCRTINQEWNAREADIRSRARACESAINATVRTFGADAFRAWTQGAYQQLFNRAVFDIMTRYFRDPNIAESAAEQGDSVRAAFQRACGNRRFLQALQSTTKSTEAVRYRIQYWGASLRKVLNVEVPNQQLPPGGKP